MATAPEPLAQTLAHESQNDPDLTRVLELWATLPDAGRSLLRTMAETLAGQLPKDQKGNGRRRETPRKSGESNRDGWEPTAKGGHFKGFLLRAVRVCLHAVRRHRRGLIYSVYVHVGTRCSHTPPAGGMGPRET
jgi:hypothetical protein